MGSTVTAGVFVAQDAIIDIARLAVAILIPMFLNFLKLTDKSPCIYISILTRIRTLNKSAPKGAVAEKVWSSDKVGLFESGFLEPEGE